MTDHDSIKFTADKRDLAAGLAWAVKGLSARPRVTILAGIRLEVGASQVTLAGFDYDMTARAYVMAAGCAPGVVLVRGRELAQAVKSLPGKPSATVTAEITGESLTVSAGGVSASAGLLDLAEYPQLPEMPPAAGVMDSAAFTVAVARVAPAACRDDTLPILCAVNLVTSAGMVALTATDRYRAAFDEVAWTPANFADAMDTPWNVSVPVAALVAFGKAADKAGKVTLHLGEAQLPRDGKPHTPPMAGFSDGTRELITRTADGDFPGIGKFLAGQGDIHASADINGPALAAALKRAGDARERNVDPVHLKVTRDGITVTAMRDGEAASRETVPAAMETDALENGRKVCGFKVAYNPDYLRSMVAGVAGTVRLSWSALGKPVQVSEADSAGGFKAIIMPVRAPAPPYSRAA